MAALIRGVVMERAPELQSGAAAHGQLHSGAASGLCTFWCMFSFSVILWLGDLNYRLEELDVAKVKQLVEEKAFLELCQYDQVLMSHLPADGVKGARYKPHDSLAFSVLNVSFLLHMEIVLELI